MKSPLNLFSLLSTLLFTAAAFSAELRIGIIGCDTSHVIAFTDLLNNPKKENHVPGGKVTAAFRGGSPDLPASLKHLDEYSATLRDKFGVTFYDTIEEMCGHVDAVLLTSIDGRPHLEQVKPIIAARKPVFVDKPMAGSLRDVLEMFRLAKAAKVPLFSASSLRFATNSLAARGGAIGRVNYAETYGPCEIEPHHPDLYWYGVHGVEALFTVLGTGCRTVQRGTTPAGKIEVVGEWSGGRKGVFREDNSFHGLAKGTKGEMPAGGWDGYAPLVAGIMKFFQTGVAPVKPEETIEIFAFMDAADESKRLGGAPVKIRDVIRRARK